MQKAPSLAALAQAEDARVQALWDAADNDEVRMSKQGRLERHEISPEDAQLLRVVPDLYSNKPHTARITSATKAVYHPLAWMKNQAEPKAVDSSSNTPLFSVKSARTQQLWNAASNDKIQADSGEGSDSPPAIKWLRAQHDEAEMSALKSHPRYAFGKDIFARGRDRARNFGGDYVDDNSIGVKIESLKARQTMLDMWDQPNPGAAASGGSDGSMTWMGFRSATDGYNRNQSPYTGPGGAQDQQAPRDPGNSAGGRVYGAPYSDTADPSYGYSDYWKQHYAGAAH